MKFSDRLLGLVLFAFAVAVLVEARSFPVIPGQSVGSGLLPTIVALGLMGSAALLVVRDLLTSPRLPLAQFGDWVHDPIRWARIAIVLVGTAAFIPLLDVIGFPILSITVLFLFMLTLQVRPLLALAVSVGSAFAIHTLFNKLFLVPLPWGLLDVIAW